MDDALPPDLDLSHASDEAVRSLRWIRRPAAGEAAAEGGLINLCFNAVDRHVVAGRSDEIALISDERGRVRSWTWAHLLEEVAALAGALRLLGVAEGSTVPLLLPPGPDLVHAALATLRLGAVPHLLPADGSAERVGDELAALAPPVLLASAGTAWSSGLDRAAETGTEIGSVIVRAAPDAASSLTEPRDLDWEFVVRAGRNDPAPCARVEAASPAYAVPAGAGWATPSVGTTALRCAAAARSLQLTAGAVWWGPLPAASQAGVELAVLAPLMAGAELVVADVAGETDAGLGADTLLDHPVARAHHVTAGAVAGPAAPEGAHGDSRQVVVALPSGPRPASWPAS